MIWDERSKYKSWSNLKKQMHDLLCDSLKDRIDYFCTSYREVHNAYGRAAIRYCQKELAAFLGKDECLVFTTGFTVNEGVIPTLVDRKDYIICDDRDHASIVDGRRLSFATQLKYKHNDMEALEKELKK